MAARRMSSVLRFSRPLSLFPPVEAVGCSQMHALPVASLHGPAAVCLLRTQLLSADRHITSSACLAASIKVPSMGESIEEGTISAILKQEGDAVEMDEAIFQIETDKVTVDVRTPEAGVLDKLMVKEDDTVRVGQELGNVSAGSGKGKAEQQSNDEPAKQASKKPSQEDTTSAKPATKVHSDTKDPHSSVEGQSESQPNADAGKVSIRFPRRRTPDGRRISDLPVQEQQQFKEQDTPQQSQAEQQQPPAKPEPQSPARQPQKSAASDPNKFTPYAGQDRGTKLSQARVLSAREIEIIELGGADP